MITLQMVRRAKLANITEPMFSRYLFLLPTTVRPTFVAKKVGAYVDSLKVNDSKVDSDVALVIITVSVAPSGLAGSS